jgi:hypothetical protein
MTVCNEKIKFTCDWIFNRLVVLSDGKVVCGCADPYGERPLGSLKENKIYEIWNSKKVKEIRKELNEGHCCFCDNCGLKRLLKKDEEVPQQPVDVKILPRIFFEPTVLCNLSCFKAVCNQESGILNTRERKQFPINEFKSLMEEIGENLIRLDFFNYGDPFVHPQAVEMIEYIKEKFPHIYLYTSTNGLLLDNKKIKRLVNSGIDEITFSVDGPDQETYIRYRKGGDFNKVLRVMSKFVEERDKVGREVPFINWRYIIFKWNDSKNKMNKTKRLAKKIGVDRLTWEITDHPSEAASEKYQIGTRSWRKIYNEIWDSSQIGNAIKNKRFYAKINIHIKDIIIKIHNPTFIDVFVKNTGGALWRKETFSGKRMIRLGAQLFDRNKNLIELNYARAFLNKALKKGEKDIIKIILPPLSDPGKYFIKFDMVSEGIDWFESGGSPVVWKNLSVIS